MIGRINGRFSGSLIGSLVGRYDLASSLESVPNLTPPSIASDGQLGQGTTFTRTAGTWEGSPTITGQWQKSTALYPDIFANIVGATGTTYVLPGSLENGARYRYAETATIGSVSTVSFSNEITLVGPSFTVNPTTSYVSDPNWANVSLLMGFNTTHAPEIFSDESSYRATMNAPSGGTNWLNSTTSPMFGSGCGWFTGSGGRPTIGVTLATQHRFGTGDFTIEGFFKPTSQPTVMGAVGNLYTDNGSWGLYYAAGKWMFTVRGQTDLANAATTAINVWTHVAVSRNGDTIRLFVNGVMVDKKTGWAAVSATGVSLNPLSVGNHGSYGATQWWQGYIDELRISTGLGRYNSDANLTVPTAAFPRDTSTPSIGTVINVTSGTATGRGNTVSYQWTRNGADIVGATTNQYTLAIADDATTIAPRVTVVNAIGSANASATGISVNYPAVFPLSENVGVTQSISGSVGDVVNRSLTENVGVTQSIIGSVGDVTLYGFNENNTNTSFINGQADFPSSGTPYYTAVSALSPVSHWKLDETSGSACADAVGLQAAVASGPNYVRNYGSFIDAGTAISFGAAAWIQADNAAYDSANFTACGWFNWNGLNSGSSLLMFAVTRTASLGSYRWQFEYNPYNGSMVVRGTTFPAISGGVALEIDTWYHIAVTYNGTTFSVYLNGVLLGSTTSLTKVTQTGPFSLITGGNNIITGWRGKIDEVSFFNTALTAPQLLSLYNAGLA